MDKSINKTIEVIKDLMKVNYDRIDAYKNATEKSVSNAIDLRIVFQNMIELGKKLAAELTTELIAHGEELNQELNLAGAIYREWMSINLIFNGTNREELLDFCEYIEDAVIQVYEDALWPDDLTETALTLFEKQKHELNNAYMEIKQLRGKELAYY